MATNEERPTRGGWEVRNEGLYGTPPYAIERGSGSDAQVFVTGISDRVEAERVAEALNDYEKEGPRYVYAD